MIEGEIHILGTSDSAYSIKEMWCPRCEPWGWDDENDRPKHKVLHSKDDRGIFVFYNFICLDCGERYGNDGDGWIDSRKSSDKQTDKNIAWANKMIRDLKLNANT